MKFLFYAIWTAAVCLKTCSTSAVTEKEYKSMPDLFHFDDYEKCMLHGDEALYCLVTLELQPSNSTNASSVWNIIQKVDSDEDNYRHDLLRHGICIQESCPTGNESLFDSLSSCYFKKYEDLGLDAKIVRLKCETNEDKYPIRTQDIFFAAVLGVYVIFVLSVSVLLEVFRSLSKERHELFCKKLLGQFLSAFSLFQNWKLLIKFNPKKQNKDFLACLQGIRFVVTIGVIITHATEMNVITPVLNPLFVEDLAKRIPTMMLSNGGVTVQIYFVMSFWLLTFNFLEKLKESKKISFVYVLRSVLARYIRFTPVYALLIALHCTWFVHLARGPFWDQIIGEDYRVCRKMWYTNLLYFNNFFIADGLCMFQSWYLSADLQLYMLALVVLWLFQKKPKLITAAAGVMSVVQIVVMFYVLFMKQWEIVLKLRPEVLHYFHLIYTEHWQMTWASTYSCLAGAATGMAFGYFYSKHKNDQLFTKKIHTILWWIASWGLLFGPIILHSWYLSSSFYTYNRWLASSYGSVSKTIYCFGAGLVIFGMTQGVGGYVKKTFEWTPMNALAQLSFCAYLVHFIILKVRVASRKAPIHVSEYFLFSEILTNTTMAYLFSAVLTLFVHMPFAILSRGIKK